MAEETATFSLEIEADKEPALEAAGALEKYRAAIEKSQSALANYRRSLQLLRGSSKEVVDAKAKLKAAIELERGKISQANLGILKLGGSYDKLAKAAKKNKEQTDAGRKAISSIGGPMKTALEKFDGLKDLLPIVSSGWGALAAGIAIGVAALALAATAVAGLTAKFTEWLATTADANRNLALTREAFSGSAKNATAWGHVLDWASEKTALTTAQMNDMVVQTEKTYRGFRISGQGMVDAFKASAAAAGAGRGEVAAFFDEILARGKMTGRTFVWGPEDAARLRNAGIDVKKLYAELGVSAAQGARGTVVSTDKMAAALRRVSESRFAEINAKKMLSLGSQWDRLKDNFMRFTNDLAGEGGALEPLLKAIQQVAMMFDLSTDSGQELKATITQYGKALADAIIKHIPDIKEFVKHAIALAGAFIRGAAAVVSFLSSSEGMTVLKIALAAVAVAAATLFVAFLPLIAVGAAIAAAFILVGAAMYGIYKAVKWLVGLDWGSIGTAIVDGIKEGLLAAWNGLKSAVTSMGEGILNAFRLSIDAHSPSRKFRAAGIDSGVGYGEGIEDSTPVAASAARSMAAASTSGAAGTPGGSASAPASGGGGVHIGNLVLQVQVVGSHDAAAQVREQLSSRSFLEGFESTWKALLQGQGIPTGGPVTAGG